MHLVTDTYNYIMPFYNISLLLVDYAQTEDIRMPDIIFSRKTI